MKYNKRILKHETMTINGRYIECYILDDVDYYNIHITDEFFQDTELNTLRLQEPKSCVTLESLDKKYMYARMIEHYMWYKFYGDNNKVFDFCVSAEISIDNLEEIA